MSATLEDQPPGSVSLLGHDPQETGCGKGATMARWVTCYLCGCTGVHRDPVTNAEYPCHNGCDGGRIYEHVNPQWFDQLVRTGAEVFEDNSPARVEPVASTR